LRAFGIALVEPGFLARAHRAGLAVDVWTVDDAAEMHRLLDLGVDGIMTDSPSVLRSVLEDRAQWPAVR
jgi:glycerophosphoryl diester phosphodiesterase